jgi:sterol desaturase/sphingolipid hydroxylase (fatty acid hydroxylase superfamily)
MMDLTILEEALGAWTRDTAVDVARYAGFALAVWFALYVALRGVVAGRRIRPEWPNLPQMALEFAISLRSVAIFSTVGLALFFLDRLGWLPGPALAAQWGPVWFWASLALMIVGHDACFYWTHRWMHHPNRFRAYHRRHHKSHNPSPFTAYSFDLREAGVLALFVTLWMAVVPTPWPVVGLFMLHQIVRNTLGHSGFELMPARKDGRPAFDWLTTTVHHDLHHAEAGWNYGLYFTWWDRWMGTEHPDYHQRFAAAVRKPLTAPAKARSAAATIATVVVGGLAATGLALLAPDGRADGAPPAAPHGLWASEGYAVVVRLEPCADPAQLCGRLVWAWDPDDVPPARIGGVMLEGFVLKDGVWTGGRLTDPSNGRVYRGGIEAVDDATLKLEGCFGPLCRREVWRRLESLPHVAGVED